MRHQKTVKKLGRTAAHRRATLSAMSEALIQHKRIQTTFVKAKALRTYVEPLLTRSKEDTTANRRQVFRHLQNKESIKELFDVIAPLIADRPGGYTRIVKIGQRVGDGTEMAIIEFVDYNTTGEAPKKAARRRTRRSTGATAKNAGGDRAAKADGTAAAATAEATPKTTPKADTPQENSPESGSDASAQAPGTPLDAPEATAGGPAANSETAPGGQAAANQG